MTTINANTTTYEVRYERWSIELTIDGEKVRETERKEYAKTFASSEAAEEEITRLRQLDGKPEMCIASKANEGNQYSVYIKRYRVVCMSEVTKTTRWFY